MSDLYQAHDINYRGENCGVHNWMTQDGHSFYWHPDWVHIAEDETGMHVKQPLELAPGEAPQKHHAIKAILRYLNGLTGH